MNQFKQCLLALENVKEPTPKEQQLAKLLFEVTASVLFARFCERIRHPTEQSVAGYEQRLNALREKFGS
jgi:hypothetical protein